MCVSLYLCARAHLGCNCGARLTWRRRGGKNDVAHHGHHYRVVSSDVPASNCIGSSSRIRSGWLATEEVCMWDHARWGGGIWVGPAHIIFGHFCAPLAPARSLLQAPLRHQSCHNTNQKAKHAEVRLVLICMCSISPRSSPLVTPFIPPNHLTPARRTTLRQAPFVL